jgi:hypothetical protein
MDDARKSEEASNYKGEEKPRLPRELDEDDATPLQAEALARDEWRGGGSVAPEDAPGHTLPASEDDDERMKGGRGSAGPSTMFPPD